MGVTIYVYMSIVRDSLSEGCKGLLMFRLTEEGDDRTGKGNSICTLS